jgi:hypothetical protein
MLTVVNVFTITISTLQDEDISQWVKNRLKPLLSEKFNMYVIGDGGLFEVSIDFVCRPYPVEKSPQQLLSAIRISTDPIIPENWEIEWTHWTYDKSD